MLKRILPILELLPILKEHIPRHRAILSLLLRDDALSLRIFDALSQTDFRTEAQLSEALGLDERSLTRQLEKLHAALLQTVFFIDTPRMEEYLGEMLDGFRKVSQMKILRLLGASNNAESLAHDIARSGKKYKNQTLQYFGNDLLSSIASDYRGEPRLFEKYQADFSRAKKYLDVENEARALFQRTQVSFVKSRSAKKNLAAGLLHDLDYLRPHFGVIDSHSFHYHFSISEINYHLIGLDYPGAYRMINLYLDHFNSMPGVYTFQMINLYSLKTATCVMLRRYDEGEKAAAAGLALTRPGTSAWYNLLIENFYLSMHAGQLDRAASLYRLGIEHRGFMARPAFLQTHWKLLGAYLQIGFAFSGKVPAGEKWFPRYKAARFANDMALFSQDKSGLNVAILIAQILLQLQEKKYDEIWERLEAVRKYRLRYTGAHASRLGLFIHILMQLPKMNFHRKPFEQKTAAAFRAMKTMPVDLTMQAQELEIIPLEKMYDMVVSSLRDSKY